MSETGDYSPPATMESLPEFKLWRTEDVDEDDVDKEEVDDENASGGCWTIGSNKKLPLNPFWEDVTRWDEGAC